MLLIVKNYIVAEEKVVKVARFSVQHFLPATISAYKVGVSSTLPWRQKLSYEENVVESCSFDIAQKISLKA